MTRRPFAARVAGRRKLLLELRRDATGSAQGVRTQRYNQMLAGFDRELKTLLAAVAEGAVSSAGRLPRSRRSRAMPARHASSSPHWRMTISVDYVIGSRPIATAEDLHPICILPAWIVLRPMPAGTVSPSGVAKSSVSVTLIDAVLVCAVRGSAGTAVTAVAANTLRSTDPTLQRE